MEMDWAINAASNMTEKYSNESSFIILLTYLGLLFRRTKKITLWMGFQYLIIEENILILWKTFIILSIFIVIICLNMYSLARYWIPQRKHHFLFFFSILEYGIRYPTHEWSIFFFQMHDYSVKHKIIYNSLNYL